MYCRCTEVDNRDIEEKIDARYLISYVAQVLYRCITRINPIDQLVDAGLHVASKGLQGSSALLLFSYSYAVSLSEKKSNLLIINKEAYCTPRKQTS